MQQSKNTTNGPDLPSHSVVTTLQPKSASPTRVAPSSFTVVAKSAVFQPSNFSLSHMYVNEQIVTNQTLVLNTLPSHAAQQTSIKDLRSRSWTSTLSLPTTLSLPRLLPPSAFHLPNPFDTSNNNIPPASSSITPSDQSPFL